MEQAASAATPKPTTAPDATPGYARNATRGVQLASLDVRTSDALTPEEEALMNLRGAGDDLVKAGVTAMDRNGFDVASDNYSVRPGDNLTKIAKRYGLSVGELAAMNGLTSSTIVPGQKLTAWGEAVSPAQARAVEAGLLARDNRSTVSGRGDGSPARGSVVINSPASTVDRLSASPEPSWSSDVANILGNPYRGPIDKFRDIVRTTGAYALNNAAEFDRMFGRVDGMDVQISLGFGTVTKTANFLRSAVVGTADDLLNGLRLRNQLAATEISQGHAFEKHVLGVSNENGAEFAGLGIRTRGQFADHIEETLTTGTVKGSLLNGREYVYDQATSTVVIRNPKAPDGGTAFRIDPKKYPDPMTYIRRLR